MKIAVVADIHSNFNALEAVLTDIKEKGADDIVSLGDNVGYGPQPEEVVQRLLSKNVQSIQGNHEYAMVNPAYFKKLNPIPQRSLEITLKMLSKQSHSFCTGLSRILIKYGARFVHGCPPKSPTSYLFRVSKKKLSKLFSSYPEHICFFGHTHTPAMFDNVSDPDKCDEIEFNVYQLDSDKRYLINPGSVGQPRDGINNKAKYLIWDTSLNTITFKAVSYDVMDTVNKLRNLGFPAFNAGRLLL